MWVNNIGFTKKFVNNFLHDGFYPDVEFYGGTKNNEKTFI